MWKGKLIKSNPRKVLGNKGFAVSGILYPILILTLFLIVQILTMMASRKAVLDKNKQELLDSVNASNKIYTNEELSVIIEEQKALIESQKAKITNLENTVANNKKISDSFQAKQELRNKQVPIGDYDIYIGDYTTSATTNQYFGRTYFPSTQIYSAQGWEPSKKVKICVVGNTTARGSADNTYAYVTIKMGDKSIEMPWTTWGELISGINITNCTEISSSYLDTSNNPHWTFYARTNNSDVMIRIYRIYLLSYEA